MTIADYCRDVLSKSHEYFQPLPGYKSVRNHHGWNNFYKKQMGKPFYHSEPWVTLMALWGLFGDQKDKNPSPLNGKRLQAINELIAKIIPGGHGFRKLPDVRLEAALQENLIFREYLHQQLQQPQLKVKHPYMDRALKINKKLTKNKARFEGSTTIDATMHSDKLDVYIEAKYLSDISTDISYLTIRNQILRSIDTILAKSTNNGKNIGTELPPFYFVLLTPGMFRTKKYGGPANVDKNSKFLKAINPSTSRLFCYVMDRYRNPNKLKSELPHWKGKLSNDMWEDLSKRIGWLTFEEIMDVVVANGHGLLEWEELNTWCNFFQERGIIPSNKRHFITAYRPQTYSPWPFDTIDELKAKLKENGWDRIIDGYTAFHGPYLTRSGTKINSEDITWDYLKKADTISKN